MRENRIDILYLNKIDPSEKSEKYMFETNFNQKLTLHAKHSLKEACEIARFTGYDTLEPKHLLMALFLENTSLGSILLENMGFEKEPLAKLCLEKKDGSNINKGPKTIVLSSSIKDTLHRAYVLAHKFHYPYVGTEHLAFALFESAKDNPLEEILSTLHINRTKIQSTFKAHLNFDHFPQLAKMLDLPDNFLTKQKTKQGITPFLDQYAIDMSKGSVYANDILIGRENELDRIIQILTRKQKNNPLLIGEPGVGKTALVSALAKMIASGGAPHSLYGKRILLLDLTLVVAGTNFRGEFESRLKEIVRETMQNKNIILFIDEIHTIVGAGNTSGGLDAANILKPALSRGEIQIIGATTFSEYKRHIEKDPALDRRFQSVVIEEPTTEETKEILWNVRKNYENFHQITLSKEIVDTAVDMSVRFIPDRFLPDKALDIIDEASALAKQKREASETIKLLIELEEDLAITKANKESFLKNEQFDDAGQWFAREKKLQKQITELESKRKNTMQDEYIPVTHEHILRTVSHMAHIPFTKLAKENPREKLIRIQKALKKYLIGQEEVSRSLEETLLRSLSNISDPNRPLGSFLFLGPTGVGKTLTAKILAREFFGDENNLIRLDMSEFMERHSVAQILGAPAGYIGYGEGGKLTEQIRRKPYSVILFDEIEKAHPDIFNILLQILDEGVLTDAEGRTVSFRNTLIILTSNIGTSSFTETARIGFTKNIKSYDLQHQFESMKQEVLSTLKKEMRPELLARLDHILVFNALDKKSVKKIVALELSLLKKRLEKQGIKLDYDLSIESYITEKSFSPEQGARLVKKNIQDRIEKSIATRLLDFPDQKTLHLSLKKDSLVCL